MDEYLKRLREYAELFYAYFPSGRGDRDIVILRGHQITETLLYLFIRKHVLCPEHIDDCRMRWDSLIALVKALREWNEETENWIWTSTVRLERARNQYAHCIDPAKADKVTADFVNSVRSNYSAFDDVPGDDNIKKAIFILYFQLSGLLALEEFPSCTATQLVREEIARECTSLIRKGLARDQNI